MAAVNLQNLWAVGHWCSASSPWYPRIISSGCVINNFLRHIGAASSIRREIAMKDTFDRSNIERLWLCASSSLQYIGTQKYGLRILVLSTVDAGFVRISASWIHSFFCLGVALAFLYVGDFQFWKLRYLPLQYFAGESFTFKKGAKVHSPEDWSLF